MYIFVVVDEGVCCDVYQIIEVLCCFLVVIDVVCFFFIAEDAV